MITRTHNLRRLTSLCIIGTTILTIAATAQQRWEQLDGPEGGEVTAFGQSGDLILVGAKSNVHTPSIFRSITNGASWAPVEDYTLPQVEVSSFASLGDTIYAGTQAGIFRSLDDGRNWSAVPGQHYFQASKRIAAQNGTFLAAGGDSAYTIGPDGALTRLTTPWPTFTPVHAVAVSNGAMFIGATAGFVRSTDRGTTWQTITLDQNAGHVISLAATGDTILALTHETGAFRSIDNGEHWEKIAATNVTVGSIAIMGTTVYLSDPYRHLIERSTDAGATWVSLRNGPAVSAIHITPTAIFAATLDEAGVLQSSDDGVTWTATNEGLFKIPGQALLPMEDDLLIGTSAGLFRMKGASDALERLTGPVAIRHLARLGDDIIYSERHGFVRWSAQLKKWIDEKIESDKDTVTALATIDDMLYIATRGTIYRAIDTGVGFTYERTAIEGVRIHSIASDESTIIATDGERIWRTTDKGASWQETWQESPFPFGTEILRVIYRNRTFYALTDGGIYSSANGDLPWRDLSSDLDRRSIYSLEYVDGALYAGTDSGMYRSLNNGESWTTFNDGIEAGNVRRLAVVGNKLYAALYFYPIHRIQVGTLSAPDERASSAANLLELRPNPTTAKGTIRYSLTRRGHASIKLFDAMGREVRTLLDEASEAGVRELQLDASGLPSGAYFLRLEIDGALTTRAVVIER